jgi:hypothetical protein
MQCHVAHRQKETLLYTKKLSGDMRLEVLMAFKRLIAVSWVVMLV